MTYIISFFKKKRFITFPATPLTDINVAGFLDEKVLFVVVVVVVPKMNYFGYHSYGFQLYLFLYHSYGFQLFSFQLYLDEEADCNLVEVETTKGFIFACAV